MKDMHGHLQKQVQDVYDRLARINSNSDIGAVSRAEQKANMLKERDEIMLELKILREKGM